MTRKRANEQGSEEVLFWTLGFEFLRIFAFVILGQRAGLRKLHANMLVSAQSRSVLVNSFIGSVLIRRLKSIAVISSFNQ